MNEDFLARWASGELSAEEKMEFENSKEFVHYKAILDGTELLKVIPYNKEALYKKTKEKADKESNSIFSIPNWAYIAAASVMLLLGSLFVFKQNKSFDTGYGEQLTITLPDDTEVILNARSLLEYDEDDWEKERTLSLEGEAYFKVAHGSTFTVNTSQGSVQVLGTRFTVNMTKGIFEVVCFEGKVKLKSKGHRNKLINPGEGVRVMGTSVESWKFNEDKPSWVANESSFNNAPLHQVITALENQYNISINSDSINVNQRFTGSFEHNDLNTALKIIFESMGIIYFKNDSNTVILSQKN